MFRMINIYFKNLPIWSNQHPCIETGGSFVIYNRPTTHIFLQNDRCYCKHKKQGVIEFKFNSTTNNLSCVKFFLVVFCYQDYCITFEIYSHFLSFENVQNTWQFQKRKGPFLHVFNHQHLKYLAFFFKFQHDHSNIMMLDPQETNVLNCSLLLQKQSFPQVVY